MLVARLMWCCQEGSDTGLDDVYVLLSKQHQAQFHSRNGGMLATQQPLLL